MELLRDGIPAGMQALFMSISSLLIQLFINGFGPEAMGGMTVFAKIEGFLYFPAFAYGIALTGFVGQNYGAGKFERIREATKISALVMTAMVLLSTFVFIPAGSVARIIVPVAGAVGALTVVFFVPNAKNDDI